MVNDTYELDIPLRPYTKALVDYSLGMAYQKDGKTAEADRKFGDFNNQKETFLRQSAPRDKSSQTYVSIKEVISGEDEGIFY